MTKPPGDVETTFCLIRPSESDEAGGKFDLTNSDLLMLMLLVVDGWDILFYYIWLFCVSQNPAWKNIGFNKKTLRRVYWGVKKDTLEFLLVLFLRRALFLRKCISKIVDFPASYLSFREDKFSSKDPLPLVGDLFSPAVSWPGSIAKGTQNCQMLQWKHSLSGKHRNVPFFFFRECVWLFWAPSWWKGSAILVVQFFTLVALASLKSNLPIHLVNSEAVSIETLSQRRVWESLEAQNSGSMTRVHDAGHISKQQLAPNCPQKKQRAVSTMHLSVHFQVFDIRIRSSVMSESCQSTDIETWTSWFSGVVPALNSRCCCGAPADASWSKMYTQFELCWRHLHPYACAMQHAGFSMQHAHTPKVWGIAVMTSLWMKPCLKHWGPHAAAHVAAYSPAQTWIALGKLVATYNFAASLFCTAQCPSRTILEPATWWRSQSCDSCRAAFAVKVSAQMGQMISTALKNSSGDGSQN